MTQNNKLNTINTIKTYLAADNTAERQNTLTDARKNFDKMFSYAATAFSASMNIQDTNDQFIEKAKQQKMEDNSILFQKYQQCLKELILVYNGWKQEVENILVPEIVINAENKERNCNELDNQQLADLTLQLNECTDQFKNVNSHYTDEYQKKKDDVVAVIGEYRAYQQQIINQNAENQNKMQTLQQQAQIIVKQQNYTYSTAQLKIKNDFKQFQSQPDEFSKILLIIDQKQQKIKQLIIKRDYLRKIKSVKVNNLFIEQKNKVLKKHEFLLKNKLQMVQKADYVQTILSNLKLTLNRNCKQLLLQKQQLQNIKQQLINKIITTNKNARIRKITMQFKAKLDKLNNKFNIQQSCFNIQIERQLQLNKPASQSIQLTRQNIAVKNAKRKNLLLQQQNLKKQLQKIKKQKRLVTQAVLNELIQQYNDLLTGYDEQHKTQQEFMVQFKFSLLQQQLKQLNSKQKQLITKLLQQLQQQLNQFKAALEIRHFKIYQLEQLDDVAELRKHVMSLKSEIELIFGKINGARQELENCFNQQIQTNKKQGYQMLEIVDLQVTKTNSQNDHTLSLPQIKSPVRNREIIMQQELDKKIQNFELKLVRSPKLTQRVELRQTEK